MPISTKSRKLLWGRSGNLCTVCREVLSKGGDIFDSDTIIGDECHIVSSATNGPRFNSELDVDFDAYDNLILLCKNHHKLIDDRPIEYSRAYLLDLKSKHEQWVKTTLYSATTFTPTHQASPDEEDEKKMMDVVLLRHLLNGKDAIDMLSVSEAALMNYDANAPEDDLRLIGAFLQDFQDWADIYNEIEISEKIDAQISVNNLIGELNNNGYLVFGTIHNQKYQATRSKVVPFRVAVLNVVKSNDDKIMSNSDGSIKGMFMIVPVWITGFMA